MDKKIGNFNQVDCETYAECLRIMVGDRDDKHGRYCVKIMDGILYLYEDGTLVKAASTFSLTIKAKLNG